MSGLLAWAAERLDRAGARYWLDTGTLLGMTRAGGLIPHDNDIDISLWREDAERLEAALSELDRREFFMKRFYFSGGLFKISVSRFRPWLPGLVRYEGMTVDFSVWDKSGAFAVCPQVVKPLGGAWNAVKNRLLWTALCHTAWDVNLDRPPWRWAYPLYTWEVPLEFFAETELSGGLRAPKRARDYLAYRYGDWTVVRKDWDSMRDDRCLRAVHPRAYLG